MSARPDDRAGHSDRDELRRHLRELRHGLDQEPSAATSGRVRALRGATIRATLPNARIGDFAWIFRAIDAGGALRCEVIGLASTADGEGAGEAVLQPLGSVRGVALADRVEIDRAASTIRIDDSWRGRVVDGLGRPIDGGAPLTSGPACILDRAAPPPLQRAPISQPIWTGFPAIDGLAPLARGARVGLFAGPGLGKSSLLGAIAQRCDVDVIVFALIGERGREIAEVARAAVAPDPAGRAPRSVVVAATSDDHPAERIAALRLATAVAEHARDRGEHALLLVDSLTRVARAQRELGLAAGEPPVRRGYPPSVFELLPRMLERAGNDARASITAIYALLVEGDDDRDDPLAEDARGLLDGHWILSRSIAARGRFPPLDPVRSIARVMPSVVGREHARAAHDVRGLLALFEDKRDLLAMNGYVRGSDARLDRAIEKQPAIEELLALGGERPVPFAETSRRLVAIAR